MDSTISFDRLYLEHVYIMRKHSVSSQFNTEAGAFVQEAAMFVGFMRKILPIPMMISLV